MSVMGTGHPAMRVAALALVGVVRGRVHDPVTQGVSQMIRPLIVSIVSGYPYTPDVTVTLIGYTRCSTDKQDLVAQRAALLDLGVAEDRIYLDRGLTGITRGTTLDRANAATS